MGEKELPMGQEKEKKSKREKEPKGKEKITARSSGTEYDNFSYVTEAQCQGVCDTLESIIECPVCGSTFVRTKDKGLHLISCCPSKMMTAKLKNIICFLLYR